MNIFKSDNVYLFIGLAIIALLVLAAAFADGGGDNCSEECDNGAEQYNR